jgi:hypothetical protein
MQATKYAPTRERTNDFVQVTLTIALFSLVMGLWAYLWVPLPIF